MQDPDCTRKKLLFHTWSIENFSLWDTNTKLDSERFVVESMAKTEFFLSLHKSVDKDGRIECDLVGETKPADGPTTFRFSFEILVLAADGSTFTKSEKEMKPFTNQHTETVDLFGMHDNDMFSKRVLHKDVLTLVCRFWEVQTQHEPNSLSVKEELVKFRTNHFNRIGVKKSRNITVPKSPIRDTGNARPCFVYDLFVYDDSKPEEFAALRFFCNTSRTPILAHFTCHLLDSDKRRCLSKSKAHMFQNDLEIWYFPEFIPMSMLLADKEKFMNDDRVSIELEILYSFTDTSLLSHWSASNSLMYTDDVELGFPRSSQKRKWDLGQGMQTLLQKRRYTDISLVADKLAVPVHKAILSARSSVFRAMFENDMSEKKKGTVDIQDMDTETLDRFLLFLYTEKFHEDDLDIEQATKLYTAADKYDIRTLKVKCSEFLSSHLKADFACDLLVIAHFYGDQDLKKSAMDVISANIDDIILTEEWAHLVDGQNSLAEEAMCYLRCKR